MTPAPIHIPLTLAEVEHAALGEALALLFVGMLVVLVALSVIASAVGLLTNLLRPEAPPPEPKAPDTPGPDPRTIAVLAAAASVACGRAVTVRRVTVLGHETPEAWVTGGRATLLGSHTPRMLR
jgi:Na+-transporting methylmalonyl-CoA/oxaloacetate decarboxylase gamma subunit